MAETSHFPVTMHTHDDRFTIHVRLTLEEESRRAFLLFQEASTATAGEVPPPMTIGGRGLALVNAVSDGLDVQLDDGQFSAVCWFDAERSS